MSVPFRHALLLGLLSMLPACGDDENQCADQIDPECAPLYNPIFEEIYSRTIVPSCAIEGGCHRGAGAAGGLRMDEIDMAYDLLVPGGRVLPGDASCSLVVRRIEDIGGLMPPGNQLLEAERCAVETWVANGAQR